MLHAHCQVGSESLSNTASPPETSTPVRPSFPHVCLGIPAHSLFTPASSFRYSGPHVEIEAYAFYYWLHLFNKFYKLCYIC